MMLTSILMGSGYLTLGINLFSYCSTLNLTFIYLVFSFLLISVAFSANFVIFYTFPIHFAKKKNRGIFLGILLFIFHLTYLLFLPLTFSLNNDNFITIGLNGKFFIIFYVIMICSVLVLSSFYCMQIYEYKNSNFILSLEIISKINPDLVQIPVNEKDLSYEKDWDD